MKILGNLSRTCALVQNASTVVAIRLLRVFSEVSDGKDHGNFTKTGEQLLQRKILMINFQLKVKLVIFISYFPLKLTQDDRTNAEYHCVIWSRLTLRDFLVQSKSD